MKGMRVENSQGVIAGSTVNAQGDVLVNGQKITNIYYSAQYQDLKNHKEKLEARFATTRLRIEKHPDDEDFKKDLLLIDQERNEVQKKLDDLQREVIQLAETFTQISINTERLKLAQQHFEAGDYTAARAILNSEQMGDEQQSLLQQKASQQQQLAETEKLLINNANEFLILARLTAVDFDSPDRFEKTREYFERSLNAAHTFDNTFAYATFLYDQRQLNVAAPFYQEALAFCRCLAETNPQTFLPYVAATLNNLGVLQKRMNNFQATETAYEEALKIRHSLAETDPQTYLPDVAITLNNIANLHTAKNEFSTAESFFLKALEINRRMAEAHPQTYLPDLLTTLINAANLQAENIEFPAAEVFYQEAFEICRSMIETDPQTYLPYMGITLHNLAGLQMDKNDLLAAESMYLESLKIRRRLAETNPQAYLPDVAATLNNMANLQTKKNKFPVADAACQEALGIYRSLAEVNPETYIPSVANTLNNLAASQLNSLWDLPKTNTEFLVVETALEESLRIRRRLAEESPQTFLPGLAETLNNLAILQSIKKEFSAAEALYEEALELRRCLAEVNPEKYLPDLMMTASNMSVFYQHLILDRQKSLTYAKEVLVTGMPFVELILKVQNYFSVALQVAEAWGLDRDAFWEEAVKARQNEEG